MDVRREKRWLARGLDATGALGAMLRAQSWAMPGGYVRVVNYHGTAPETRDALAAQLAFYARAFTPVTRDDLDRLFATGRWHKDRPGLIVSFDDGLRSNADVAAPLLEAHGFVGWFFVPTDFVDEPAETQVAFARAHQIQVVAPEGERVALSWSELRDLTSRGHVVGAHTRSHVRLSRALPEDSLRREIAGSRARVEEMLGGACDTFCWVGGEEHSYSAEAARAVREAGYRYGFMTNNAPVTAGTDPLQIQRTNVESSWPVEVVRFQLSGLMDVLYAPKRRRVNALTR